MTNPHYTEDFKGVEYRRATAADVRAEFKRVEEAFRRLPDLERASRVIETATAVPGHPNIYTFDSNGVVGVWPPLNGTLVTIDEWSAPNTGPAFLLHTGTDLYTNWPDLDPLEFPADAVGIEAEQSGLITRTATRTGRLLTDGRTMAAGDLSKTLEFQYVRETDETGYWEVITRVRSVIARDVTVAIDAVGFPAIGQITAHSIPEDPVPPDPLDWPLHPDGVFFRNNAGTAKVLIMTIYKGSRRLTAAEHGDPTTYQWLRNGQTFSPFVRPPAGYQGTTNRYLVVNAEDISRGDSDQFSCTVTFED